MVAFYKGLTSSGSLGWITANDICSQNGVACNTGGYVVSM